jgi:hypothetical protein
VAGQKWAMSVTLNHVTKKRLLINDRLVGVLVNREILTPIVSTPKGPT